MPTIPGKVDWQRLSQDEFDRIVEALLIRHHEDADDGSRAEAIDGRGGDGGRDVDVERAGGLEIIYQLKYFPEGFSGGFRDTRRRQIKRSFEAAMKSAPRRWILVLPRNPTSNERSWVRKLAGKRRVEIAIWGQAKLDSELADRPDLLAWATRDQLVETLKTFNMEQAALVTAADLDQRLENLQGQIAGRSPYWDLRVEMDPAGTVTQTLVGKTADAHLKEPISISFGVDRTALDHGAQSALEQFNDYGLGSVNLPADAVKDFKIDGPEWVRRSGESVHIQFGPRPQLNEPVTLRTIDADEFVISALSGFVTDVGSGKKGQSLRLACAGGLQIELLVDADGPGAYAHIVQSATGEKATDALAAIELVESMPRAKAVQVLRGSEVLLGLEVKPEEDLLSAPPYNRLLAEDLAVISAYARMPLEMPETLSAYQREEIRRLRLLIDGCVIVEPAFGKLTSTLSGDEPEKILQLLNDGMFAAAVTLERLTYDILGHRIAIRDVVAYQPRAVADADASLRDALANGTAAGHSLTVRGADREPFWAYAPARMQPGADLTPVPLNIAGFDDEHVLLPPPNESP